MIYRTNSDQAGNPGATVQKRCLECIQEPKFFFLDRLSLSISPRRVIQSMADCCEGCGPPLSLFSAEAFRQHV